MPMYGGYEGPSVYEGRIDPANGSFTLEASMRGVRHVLVVGTDKQPLKVFAVDVIVGGKNDAGDLDLSGSCPK